MAKSMKRIEKTLEINIEGKTIIRYPVYLPNKLNSIRSIFYFLSISLRNKNYSAINNIPADLESIKNLTITIQE